ncbi:MAG TPA: helix-turn-helix transcriptional regulator, partial [Iamia sp.]
GAFLRSRREATSPESVGLASGTRRRTPGLRRAELATLAGVSVDYLIRIEQGRDTNPSAQVVAALADALGLDEDEMNHLRMLTVVGHSAELCPAPTPPAQEVRPTVRALLAQLEPAPAIVVNHLSDVLAWTEGYERLAAPLGLLDQPRPNLVAFAFLDDRARTAYPDWADVAIDMATSLHAQQRGPDDDARRFADHLAAEGGASFTEAWDRVAIAPRRTGVHAVAHPDVGVLRLAFEILDLPDNDRQRLIAYLPADEATATGLDRLAGRGPGQLRAVAPA